MRIQILPLPSVVVGDDVQEPFALIVDQHDSDVDQQTADEWHQFKTSAGARALLITPDTVEVVDRYAEPSLPEPSSKSGGAIPTLLSLDTIVLRDRNGNPMNMSVTCSCGNAMARTWTAYGPDARDTTEVACKACSNRLTITVPLGGQP